MKHQDHITKLRERVAQCRRLADATTDPRTAVTLQGMAEEGEADLERLMGNGADLSDT